MKGIILLALNIVFVLIVITASISAYDYFYHMKQKNCESIIGSNYQVSTEDVSDCYRFYNFPFWSFTIKYIVTIVLILVMVGLIEFAVAVSSL